ncbi:hypothetical protein M0R45_027147 [Rubus argutus]|uniref:Uncharacterized protein n=1 Tax=Rubus argutus TaxID=59490 RepID=A0AAW1X388_RUBAR
MADNGGFLVIEAGLRDEVRPRVGEGEAVEGSVMAGLKARLDKHRRSTESRAEPSLAWINLSFGDSSLAIKLPRTHRSSFNPPPRSPAKSQSYKEITIKIKKSQSSCSHDFDADVSVAPPALS